MPTSNETRGPTNGPERLAYLALALAPGLGPVRIRSLLDACHSAYGAITAPFAFLRTVPGIGPTLARIVADASPDAAAEVVRRTEAEGGVVLLHGDPAWPELGLPAESAPVCLFAAGSLDLLSRPAVAIVGSRSHTGYGRRVCADVAGRAAAVGLAVVSGMARGLDAVAHEAALRVGGATIGVLGNGLGVVYPAGNRRLYGEVRHRGLLLTEYPPGTPPTEGSFPERNRIIAALARATVVIEAAARSGALITANFANDLSRHVLAVPGPVTSLHSVGTNRLVQHGAHPLLALDDLLVHYPELDRKPATPGASPGTTTSQRLLAMLAQGPSDVDTLARKLALPVPALLAELGELEVEGQVRQEPGMVFTSARSVLVAEHSAGRATV